MTARRGGDLGGVADGAPGGGAQIETLCDTNGMMTRQERLDYIAEMAAELEVMAARAGCRTLTGLLELAAAEARLRRLG